MELIYLRTTLISWIVLWSLFPNDYPIQGIKNLKQLSQKMNGMQLTSPSKPIQLLKLGVTVSCIGDRVIKDEDIESIVEGINNFIFMMKAGETFRIDKSILKDSILSQEVSRLMGQVPPLIGQVGTTLFQEINQSLSVDECCQFVSPSKKIKKDQKNQNKLNQSSKKKPRGGRGSKKNCEASK